MLTTLRVSNLVWSYAVAVLEMGDFVVVSPLLFFLPVYSTAVWIDLSLYMENRFDTSDTVPQI